MDNFQDFCTKAKITNISKFNAAICFVWFHQRLMDKEEIDISTLNSYFVKAHLPAYNNTRLKDALTGSKSITRGVKQGTFKLNRKALDALNEKFSSFLEKPPITIHEKAKLSETPFLEAVDISNAHTMGQLYIIVHCYENSVRKFIEKVLSENIGLTWWDTVSNKDLSDKYNSRAGKEKKEKWVSSRGASPLYYLDWSDLVKIIRKEEKYFMPFVNDIKWVELRFEELERIRNIVAHNGVIPDSDEFDRIVLYFKDWCKQIKS